MHNPASPLKVAVRFTKNFSNAQPGGGKPSFYTWPTASVPSRLPRARWMNFSVFETGRSRRFSICVGGTRSPGLFKTSDSLEPPITGAPEHPDRCQAGGRLTSGFPHQWKSGSPVQDKDDDLRFRGIVRLNPVLETEEGLTTR